LHNEQTDVKAMYDQCFALHYSQDASVESIHLKTVNNRTFTKLSMVNC